MMKSLIKFIVLGVTLLAFSGCDAWDEGEHPQVAAIKKIADYSDSNNSKTKAPNVKLYKAAGVSIDASDLNVTNTYIKSLSSRDVDTREKIQDIVDNIDELTAAPNEKPIAVINVVSNNVDAGDTVFFDAIKSTDSDGEIVKYEWKNGATLLASGISYDAARMPQGRHIITLVVTDNDGGTGVAHTSVVVSKNKIVVIAENKAPIAVITVNDNNGTITLDADKSTDRDGNITKYVWKEGSVSLAQTKIYEVKLAKGKHTISLTVTDNNNSSNTATKEINVK